MQIDHYFNTQDGCSHVVKDGCPHVDTIWPPQDGQRERTVGRDQDFKGWQLGVIKPVGEGS